MLLRISKQPTEIFGDSVTIWVDSIHYGALLPIQSSTICRADTWPRIFPEYPKEILRLLYKCSILYHVILQINNLVRGSHSATWASGTCRTGGTTRTTRTTRRTRTTWWDKSDYCNPPRWWRRARCWVVSSESRQPRSRRIHHTVPYWIGDKYVMCVFRLLSVFIFLLT